MVSGKVSRVAFLSAKPIKKLLQVLPAGVISLNGG
jgi:hypothetical protein